ncbi:MAG TPA: hypothetical protein VEX88_12265 [Glaciibacter sp.]|nr:hypothetical protein [Glaciibacter sp.]
MTIPPMEFPPSRATNKAVPVPIGSDADLTVEPDDPQADGGTAAPSGDSATDDRGGDVDR